MAPRLRSARTRRAHLPTHDGDEWKLHDWQNWRRRVYQPAAKKAGVTGDLRVYRLRGSFVSLLLWEGRSLTFVADQAGHSVATIAQHYAGVLEEHEDKPKPPLRMPSETPAAN
jgi:site-specific recombinase XerD